MNTCGVCNSKGSLITYFSLKDHSVFYVVECPVCGNKTNPRKSDTAAIKEWEKLCPTLF